MYWVVSGSGGWCEEALQEQSVCDVGGVHARRRIATAQDNRNMSKSKGWTLQSSLLTLWMEKTQINNQTEIADNGNLLITL